MRGTSLMNVEEDCSEELRHSTLQGADTPRDHCSIRHGANALAPCRLSCGCEAHVKHNVHRRSSQHKEPVRHRTRETMWRPCDPSSSTLSLLKASSLQRGCDRLQHVPRQHSAQPC
jgi:hypothetical protein